MVLMRFIVILPAKVARALMLDEVQRHVDKSSSPNICPLKPTHRKPSRLVCMHSEEVSSQIPRSLLCRLGDRRGSTGRWIGSGRPIVIEEHR